MLTRSLLFLFLLPLTTFGQSKIIGQGNIQIKVEPAPVDPENDYGLKMLQFSSVSASLNAEPITFIIFEEGLDCNSASIELGDYRIEGSSLVLYSYWGFGGDARASPCGVRKQTYVLNDQQQLELKESLISLEPGQMSELAAEYENFLMEYDGTNPEEEAKQRQLMNERIGEAYNGSVVEGEQSTALEEEVHKVLKELIELHTASWDDDERMQNFGICR